MLFIPGNLLPKPREFSEPQWIKDKGKRNSGALEFFGTAQRRFGLSREEMGEKKETTPGRVWCFFFSRRSAVGGEGAKEKAPSGGVLKFVFPRKSSFSPWKSNPGDGRWTPGAELQNSSQK